MKLIVDASVAVKWWFTERHTAGSRQLLSHGFVLCAPDLLLTEAANVIWKKARRKELADPQPHLEELTRLSRVVVLCPSTDLVAHALDIGLAIHHPVCDCLCLACAEVEEAPLVTADGKLRDAARGYSRVDVWHIAAPEVGERIATAATARVIHEATVRELIATYVVFNDTANTIIDTVPRQRSELGMPTPEDQGAYSDMPANRELAKRIARLSDHERIDLMALAYFGFGRAGTESSTWSRCLDQALRHRAVYDDIRYEAELGRYWQAGLDRLRDELPDSRADCYRCPRVAASPSTGSVRAWG